MGSYGAGRWGEPVSVSLHLGDCLSVLRSLRDGSVDAVVTDPPYGVGLGVGKDKRRDGRHLGKPAYADFADSYDDFVTLIVPRLNAALDQAARAAVFTGPHIWEQRKADAIGGVFHPSAVGRNCWGFKNFLPVLFYGKAQDLNRGSYPTAIRSTASAERIDGHPCPKPLEWMEWLVERTTRPGQTVLDPFMGSGTTGVACVNTGRNFIGCEIDPGYYAIAERRIAEAQVARAELLIA